MADIQITDEDLVPLDLFDEAISQKENKVSERRDFLNRLVGEGKQKAKTAIE